MFVEVLKSKISEVVVTDSSIDYEGSVTLCPDLIERAGLSVWEKVDINNMTNGERITTYVLKGEKGDCQINGAASFKFSKGDRVHILSYIAIPRKTTEVHTPVVI